MPKRCLPCVLLIWAAGGIACDTAEERANRHFRAALSELDDAIAGEPAHGTLFRALRAALVFETGRTGAAIAEMQAVLDGAAPSAETDNLKVALARMLIADDGNAASARALIDEVLEADPSHTEAIRLKATRLIGQDRAGDAITLLRAALGHSPRDARLMSLLAEAPRLLAAQGRPEALIGLWDARAAQAAPGDRRAEVVLIRAHITVGDADTALIRTAHA